MLDLGHLHGSPGITAATINTDRVKLLGYWLVTYHLLVDGVHGYWLELQELCRTHFKHSAGHHFTSGLLSFSWPSLHFRLAIIQLAIISLQACYHSASYHFTSGLLSFSWPSLHFRLAIIQLAITSLQACYHSAGHHFTSGLLSFSWPSFHFRLAIIQLAIISLQACYHSASYHFTSGLLSFS